MKQRIEFTDLSLLKKAIKKADLVLCEIRFGVAEQEIAITKKEALTFLDSIAPDTTPKRFEMYSGIFGYEEEGVVHLG